MTIAIKITNTDPRPEAVVAVKVQSVAGEPREWNPPIRLKGGEERELYVHKHQQLVVEEAGDV